ncbi:hypothetical protein [Tenacibaculum sp. L6]|uniref:hypothetical protein n=1 Tax=Tenacibaculum sp. L6 TaxID=2992764 RepID=UPI00237A6A77|nr:hypothetical protein [Tenacibaculum sp. L6]MDE0536252.1 hypothetical protein [Tenacibaculum sp. L6]
MYKKLVVLALFLFFTLNSSAQCAMCKAVIEGDNPSVAEGVNNGITYLMVFPYILVGTLFYFIYRHKKKGKE